MAAGRDAQQHGDRLPRRQLDAVAGHDQQPVLRECRRRAGAASRLSGRAVAVGARRSCTAPSVRPRTQLTPPGFKTFNGTTTQCGPGEYRGGWGRPAASAACSRCGAGIAVELAEEIVRYAVTPDATPTSVFVATDVESCCACLRGCGCPPVARPRPQRDRPLPPPALTRRCRAAAALQT